jgi:GT2 family glycosyltransferase
MPTADLPARTKSVWCTELDLGHHWPQSLVAPRIPEFDSVRVLVRLHGEPLQFAERTLVNGQIATGDLLAGLSDSAHARLIAHLQLDGASLPDRSSLVSALALDIPDRCNRPDPTPLSVTVVVCTRGRGQELRGCLRALAAMVNTGLDFVIVDNAPVDHHTEDAFFAEVGDDPRFRYVVEPRPGLSCARNRGLAEATGEIIAFTDDDVIVDPSWVSGLLAGFDRRPDVACVTSLVCTAALHTPAEHYFDARVSWASRCEPRVYDQTAPDGDALYPYAPGLFGTGAGMAFRTEVIRQLGGFDEALGAGTRTGGGEDLDAFVRILLSGHALAYEPGSVVWHHHRSDLDALRRQMYFYGSGLTAFVAKHLLQKSTRAGLLRRIPRGVAKMISVPKTTKVAADPAGVPTRALLIREFRGMAMGPVLYVVARRHVPDQLAVAPNEVRPQRAHHLSAVHTKGSAHQGLGR